MNRLKRAVNNLDIRSFRFWVQIVLFVVIMWGGSLFHWDWGNDVPIFSCPYVGDSRVGTCFLFAFQHRINMPADQIISFRGLGLVIMLLGFWAFLLVFNKAWCGFACPLGTIQDWITKLRVKLGIKGHEHKEENYSRLSKVKWVLLALLIILPFMVSNSFFGMGKLSHDWGTPFCQICPSRVLLPIFNGDLEGLAIDFSSKTNMALTFLGLVVTGVGLVASFMKPRILCHLCPMSAAQFIFSKASLFRLTKKGGDCTRCGNCYRVCEIGIREIADDVTSKNILKEDCTLCMKCVAVCPEEGCLSVKFGPWDIYSATEEGFYKRQNKQEEKWKTRVKNS